MLCRFSSNRLENPASSKFINNFMDARMCVELSKAIDRSAIMDDHETFSSLIIGGNGFMSS